jgi:hypothetical protein
MAVNCCVVPEEIEGLAGVTEIDVRFATVTVTVVEPLTAANVALIVADPEATPVTSPVELTVAVVASDDDQLAEFVTLSVLPLSYVPVAVICCVLPMATEGVEGATVTVVRVGPIKNPLHPIMPTAITVQIQKRRLLDSAATTVT